MRAAIYCRISQDQTGEGLGVTRQLEDCSELAKSLGWDVVEVYSDNDISAASGKPRPEYRRLLADIQAGTIDAVVCWHPDRLYRRMVDLQELLDIVRPAQTKIATVKAGQVDLTTDAGQMLAEILASVAGYEGRAKATRWRRSVLQRREAGAMPSSRSRMYGWTREGEVIEEEAEQIRWMADEILSGTSLHSLTRKAHERGLRTTMGNPWVKQSLKRLLTNPRLAGFSKLNNEIVGMGQWEPILDPQAWETVKALVTAGTPKGNRARVALLAGMIFCGECEAPCVTGSRTRKAGGSQRVYRCTREPGRGGCGKVSGHADPIEEIVEGVARAYLYTPEARERVASMNVGDRGALAQESLGLEERVRELEAQLDEPGVPVQTILRAIDRAKTRLEEVQHALASRVPVVIPRNDAEWPTELDKRRRLVAIALEGYRVYLDRTVSGGKFKPERVRIEEVV